MPVPRFPLQAEQVKKAVQVVHCQAQTKGYELNFTWAGVRCGVVVSGRAGGDADRVLQVLRVLAAGAADQLVSCPAGVAVVEGALVAGGAGGVAGWGYKIVIT